MRRFYSSLGQYLRMQRWSSWRGRSRIWHSPALRRRIHSALRTRISSHLLLPSSFISSHIVAVCTPHPRQFSCRNGFLLKHDSVPEFEVGSIMSAELESTETCTDSSQDENSFDVAKDKVSLVEKINSTCSGCGAKFQSRDPDARGFIPKSKLDVLQKLSSGTEETSSSSTNVSPIICKRCFSLKQYNTALNISLSSDDYLRYLSHLREKKALILLMVDISDFPGSVFPDLYTLLSPDSQIVIVANKVDLIPKDTPSNFWDYFKKMLIEDCKRLSLADREIARVHFVSAKTGLGVSELAEDIVESWGNRGDVYLLGCTNAGKSTLFNRLLVYMCGVKPGELNADGKAFAPMATISQWPGTTLGLLSFPIMSVGKRRRLMAQAQARRYQLALNPPETLDDEYFERLAFDDEEEIPDEKLMKGRGYDLQDTEAEDILKSIGIYRDRKSSKITEMAPMNRFWLHDTPGAINDAQLINLLTSKELRLALPKKPLKPRTFILKPGQCLLVGGLARLDYEQGPVSAYFTVFAGSYIPVHVSKIEKADGVYERNVGTHLLKIPIAEGDRMDHFPLLKSEQLTIHGTGWKASTADIVLSSAGWVSVTIGQGNAALLRAHTPRGKGIFVRDPPLFPLAVNQRGKRSQKGNRSSFKGKVKK